jgi:hypothetical protein
VDIGESGGVLGLLLERGSRNCLVAADKLEELEEDEGLGVCMCARDRVSVGAAEGLEERAESEAEGLIAKAEAHEVLWGKGEAGGEDAAADLAAAAAAALAAACIKPGLMFAAAAAKEDGLGLGALAEAPAGFAGTESRVLALPSRVASR